MGQTIGPSWAKSESQHTLAEVRFAPKAEVGNLERIECSAYEDSSKRK